MQDEERLALGEEFRAARLQRGDDLAAVAAKLRIRADHLQAIEDGRFDDLPGKTYASGFLRSYARHLGLDPNAALARYRQESRNDPSANTLYFPEPIREARRPRAWLVALALILLGGVYAAWYYGSAERRVAQGVWPLPDHAAGTAEPGLGTAPTQPTDATTEQAAQPESGFAAATPQPPQAGYPAAAAPTAATPATATPTIDGQQPATLRGEGAPDAAVHGDTAAAAMGPRDWRSEPTTAPGTGVTTQPADGASADGTSATAGPVQAQPPADVAANGLGLDANGTWTAPRTGAPQTPPAAAQAQNERNRAPEFGNLIAATRGTQGADGQDGAAAQDRVAALPPEGTPAARSGEAPAPAEGNAGGTQQTMASLHPVTLHARGATWIQLRSQDGNVLISRIFQPGESYQVPDETGLTLTTGNAGGLDIEVDGSHTGPIGPVGAVRRHISIDRLRADAR